MNFGYLLKWIIPIEVQDEERPTSPALLILLLAHYLYSNDTSGVLLLLLLLVRNVKGECLERVCGGSFYSFKGRFPPSTNMGTLTTAFWRIRSAFPPKFSRRGLPVRSAEPPVPPLATALLWYTAWWFLMLDDRSWGLVCRFGLVCGPPLHVWRRTWSSATLSVYSSCFLLISGMGACIPRITKTRGNG